MTELITQNPILSLILATATVTGVMWKVFHELYVKPRDFRIDMLKEDMARLSSQLEELRNLRETRVVAESGLAGGSSKTEAQSNDPKTLEKRPLSVSRSAERPPRPADRIEQRPTDSQSLATSSLPTAKSTQSSKSPADSLAAFYEHWSDPSITKLQKQKFERDWTGKDVRWVVSVEYISEASHGNIFVSVRDGPRDKFTTPRAMLIFSERKVELLLSLQPGDPIVVTGKIREFIINPMLDALTVERV